ncbi:alpha/beta fold hydrolase [Burkholderia glumae]|nr:alpha/beta fold hydrolase [Burkholderia glumae]MCQ0029906.1 alpha/beta fold hydrolase [Burkholderia glumae]MCQ0035377.1 alpha/beta fold hydrolase [Burkholderia glumae]
MELRGYGKSVVQDPQAALALSDYVADLDKVTADEANGKTVLFGYSHGGDFTTAYALAHPDRVGALILVEPALYRPKEDLIERARKAAAGDKAGAVERVLRYVDPTVGLVHERASRVVQSIVANINSDNLLAQEFTIREENPISDENPARLQVLVLLIGGTGSHVSFMVKRAAQALPFASIFWVQGATHLDLQGDKHADAISGAVEAFLKSVG